MNASNWMKRFAAIAGSALMGLTLTIGANAANPETIPVDVTFVAPIGISAVTNLNFGLVDVAFVDPDTITVNPDSSFSESASNIVGGTKAAASMTITSIGSTGITITADTPTNGTYWTLGSFTCNYDAGSDTACGSGYNVGSSVSGVATLLVGAVLTGVVGGASAGADPGSFEVTVIYQ
jgi:hypothetical protein